MSARELERQRREYEREQKRLYEQAQREDAEGRNHRLAAWLDRLDSLFADGAASARPLDFETMKLRITEFDPGGLATPEPPPNPSEFSPEPLKWYERIRPDAESRKADRWRAVRARFEAAEAAWQEREQHRKNRLDELRSRHERETGKAREQHARIEELRADFSSGKRAAVEECITSVLSQSRYPKSFPKKFVVIYLSRPQQLLLEYEFPLVDAIIPTDGTWKYNRTQDRIEATTRTITDRRERYKSVLTQIAVRTLYEIFIADANGVIQQLVFNGVAEDINPATGKRTRPPLVSVRAEREEFLGDRDFHQAKFSPMACLKDLRAQVSRAPAELEPIEPVLRFEPDKARIIEEEEILSSLNEGQNIMDLTWAAFETLIRDLFNRMGFDTYQTKPSRDGGVDCFAFLQHAVVGMKVIIQAKQYSQRVPVEAVRDLAGAIDNERAGKGILATTSDFTTAGRRFADETNVSS